MLGNSNFKDMDFFWVDVKNLGEGDLEARSGVKEKQSFEDFSIKRRTRKKQSVGFAEDIRKP